MDEATRARHLDNLAEFDKARAAMLARWEAEDAATAESRKEALASFDRGRADFTAATGLGMVEDTALPADAPDATPPTETPPADPVA